jgi:F-type H+-transporting ATPase subunit b
MRDDAQGEAKKSADKIIDDARAAIRVEKEAALKDVKIQVAMFSLQVAEKLIKKNLSTDKAQKELAEGYINDLKLN